jgi:tetratricopeptide (TPR) repeat protein
MHTIVCFRHGILCPFAIFIAILPSWFATCSVSQTKLETTEAPSYQAEAMVWELSETVYRFNADGTGEKTMHVRVKLQNEAGARQLSVLSLPYASANESPQLDAVSVHHPDGTTTETPTSDAMDMPAPVTQQAPLYSDLKLLQIPVRSLRAGDTLEYRVSIQRKNPEAPGQFWENFAFEKSTVVLAQTLTLDVPAGKYVQVWSPESTPAVTESGGRRIYVWTSSQLKPTSQDAKKDNAAAAPAPNKADVGWTTFHSWEEVGNWYRGLAAPRMVPTDALRAQAGEITRDAKSPLEQVQALYAFVSTHVRYVGIDFGIGRYQPHVPAEVLANQYGDCKDKDTLLEALLHAEGFNSGPALIGTEIELVPELPSPGFFNHVITTVELPNGRIWMDTTPGVAPFQLLMEPIRDKQALVIPSTGSARLERTPAQTPFPFTDRFEATATLKSDGELNGKVNISFRSDNEVLVRLIAENLAPAQWDKGTQLLANSMGFGGTTSNSSFGRADETSQPMQVSYDYTRKPFGDWDNLRIVPLFPVVSLPVAPEKQPDAEIQLGALRTESAVSRIKLPEGYSADLPDAVHVKTPFVTFDKIYKLEEGTLIAERTIAVLDSKVPAASWEQYKKFGKDISLGDETWVQLTAPASGNGSAHPAQEGGNNPDAARLVSEANALERNRDWDGTLAKLDEAKKINPEQAYLWSNYGYVAMMQNRTEEANDDFRRELARHPDESYVVQLFAGYLSAHGDRLEALQVLNAFFDRNASDGGIDVMLASMQSATSLTNAIATLRRAADALPNNEGVLTALGDYLIRNHQEAEAAAMMKKQLAGGSDDPGLLNDAAYVLAETNTDLPLAEESSRKSLDILDERTASMEVSEANQDSFLRSFLIVAGWDTLGFILMKENKLDEAQDYLEAAWRNRPDPDVGLHYGQLEEARGNAKEALRIYELADHRAPHLPGALNFALNEIEANIKRLRQAKVPSTVEFDAESILQDDRTFKVKLKSASSSYWSATYRLLLTANGTHSAMEAGGLGPRTGVVEAIEQVALPHLVPTHSKGRLLRDGVVSCSAGKSECMFVLMPMGMMNAERTQ